MVHIIFRDILLSFLLGLTALTVIMLASLNPPQKENDATTSPGNLAITVCWPEGAYDVDAWVKAPGDEKAVGYSNRGSKTLNLLRDDLGEANDLMPVNCENVFSRGLPDGEYVVNVHYYKGAKLPLPVTVEVRLGDRRGVSAKIFEKSVTLVREGQEITVVRFKLRGGKVDPASVNHVYAPLRSAKK